MYGSPEGLAMIIGIVIFAYLFWITVVLAGYIFKGIALSRLAKNAGLPNPALAWVPIASTWLLGTLCGRSQQLLTGRRWRFDLLLPVLEVLTAGCGSLLAGTGGLLVEGFVYAGFSYSSAREALGTCLGLAYLFAMATALFWLYQAYAPGRGLLYAILSVIFGGVGLGILLMTIRNKAPLSTGPRGQQPPYPPASPWQSGYTVPPPSGSGTTGWGRPPSQNGPFTTGWNRPPAEREDHRPGSGPEL